jgi:hypothetical protein
MVKKPNRPQQVLGPALADKGSLALPPINQPFCLQVIEAAPRRRGGNLKFLA